MNTLTRFSLMALLFSAVSATPLLADTIPYGGSMTPLPVAGSGALSTVLASTGLQSFAFGGNPATPGHKATFPLDTGTFEAEVGNTAANPYGVDALTFEYQFTVTKGDVQKISISDFTGISTEVAVASGDLPGFSGGTALAPVSVNRSTAGDNLVFTFDPDAFKGDTSYILIVYTDATTYTGSTVGLIDSGAGTYAGFQPNGRPVNPNLSSVPEPSSLLLLGTGLLGVAAFGHRRFSF